MKLKTKVSLLNDLVLYPSGYQKAHSYRIPTLLKLANKKLISIVDQRVENAMDCPMATIHQISRYSLDNGKTWSEGNVFLKVEQLNDSLVSAIDSVSVQDSFDNAIYLMVDIFPGGSGIIRTSKKMNPLVESGVGLTPDKKYQRFFQLNSNKKFVLKKLPKQLKNSNWLQVYELKDNNWNNTNDNNLLATKIFVNNSYNPQTKVLHGSVYENVSDYLNLDPKIKPVCSIFDGFNHHNPNYQKPKYYIDSTAYIYLFKSNDDGLSWEMMGQINNQIAHDSNIKAIVMGPGKGLQLKNQKETKRNNRIIFPVYSAADYEIPGHFYVAYSDDHGKNWKTGNYANPKGFKQWKWTSEAQLIESKDGKVFAFLRQEEQNCYCLAVSDDGCETWKSTFDNNNEYPLTKYNYDGLNTVIMYGLASFSYKNDEYAIVSLPTTFERKNGKLFLLNLKSLQNLIPIYNFGKNGDTFGYSTIEVLEQSNNELTIGVLFEVSKTRNKTLAWIGFDEKESDYSLATEIIYQTLKISFEN